MNSVVAAPVVGKLEEIDAGLDIEFVANRLRDPWRALPILGPLVRNKLPWLEALPVAVENRADECVVRQLVPRGIAARTR